MSHLRRRLVVAFVGAVLGILLGVGLAWNVLLDPGDKGDTSTDLVTPTLLARTARVFDIIPDESQVHFVTKVRGVELNGVFPVDGGAITLEPEGDELQVHVYLKIMVDQVDTGTPAINSILRAQMATGDYPLAFYVASSRDLVPVTEEEITFMLDGNLEVHNVVAPHSMSVRAQLVGGDMWAVATSDLDLANHGVEFPAIFGDTVIKLTARLSAYEVKAAPPAGTPTPAAAQ